MLEVKDLKKSYKPKKGVAVEALKGINLKFPETGMVFLLGKSGSGKSTLLNLLGGLDQYDDGEIVIKGVSSKSFKQNQFDSYRNTYVGFIFQEYNILEEFSVGANIALAIELQGRKAKDSEINQILTTVDLEGLGNRKPNELSGGQKQRVAIARALVKNPQIIMADEPTGALDSNTGKQVLDTLKKLSRDKLVIVVSHDREFAENYADRIIELADGEVISDVERSEGSGEAEVSVGMELNSDGIVFAQGYHLTEEDRILINEYLSGKTEKVKAVVKGRKRGGFEETDQTKIVHHDRVFQLIKSHLPLGNAVKIGASSLKHKKIRLGITILLSLVAFSLFALADTFGSYDNVKTCTESLIDSKVDYVSYAKQGEYEDDDSKSLDYGAFTKDEVKKASEETGQNFKGVLVPDIDWMMSNYGESEELSENGEESTYCTYYSGFVSLTEEDFNAYGYNFVKGSIPSAKDEAAISVYVFDTFKKAGYCEKQGAKAEKIESYGDMIGKTIQVGKETFKISGIYDTHLDLERYAVVGKDLSNASMAERLGAYALSAELSEMKGYSLSGAVVVTDEKMEELMQEQFQKVPVTGSSIQGETKNGLLEAMYISKFESVDPSKVTWVDGERTALAKDEVLLSSDCLMMDEEVTVGSIFKEIKNSDKIRFTFNDIMGEEKIKFGKKKVVGVVDTEQFPEYCSTIILPDQDYQEEWDLLRGDYEYVVAPMPSKKSAVKDLVEYGLKVQDKKGNEKITYEMRNTVTNELSSIDIVLKFFAKGFIYVGLGFALFAALMLANFIATSVSYKKQEIGILRAIGARSSDVFKIFSAEAMIIALVNFLLACIGTYVAVYTINYWMRISLGALITVLNFGWRQILLLLLISVCVALVASFIPVYRIARKKPIDAIRNK